MSKKLNIKCDNCGAVNEVDASEFEYESEVEERSMGKHEEIWGSYEFDCSNNGCGNSISIETNETEYPEGCFEEGEVTIKGGELV